MGTPLELEVSGSVSGDGDTTKAQGAIESVEGAEQYPTVTAMIKDMGREQNFPRCAVHFRAPRPLLR